MRLMDFIVEGFKEVEARFVASGADPAEVKTAIASFKDLVNRNQIQDEKDATGRLINNLRNIDWWGKNKTFQEFDKFIQQKSVGSTKTQVKRSKDVGRSINLHEDDDWLIVVPLDKDASCFHGKNSDWCTTKHDQSHFEEYFYDRNIVLIYCINKQTGAKWAIADYQDVEFPDEEDMDEDERASYEEIKDNGWAELFDQQDRPISHQKFNQQTGLDSEDIQGMAVDRLPEIRQRWQTRQAQLSAIKKKQSQGAVIERDTEAEREIIDAGDDASAYKYVSELGNAGVDVGVLPFKVQFLAAKRTNQDSIIQWIKNPDPKIVELSVGKQKNALNYLLDKETLDTKILARVPPRAVNVDVVKKLIAKNWFTDELRKNLASDLFGLSAMHSAGVKLTPADIENQYVNDKNKQKNIAIYDIVEGMKKYGMMPTQNMMAHAAKLINTNVDDVSKQITDRLERDINYRTSRYDLTKERMARLAEKIKDAQDQNIQEQNRLKELEAIPTPSYREISEIRNIKYQINYNKQLIPGYQTDINASAKSLDKDMIEANQLKALLGKFASQRY